MRRVSTAVTFALLITSAAADAMAQAKPSLAPTPRVVTIDQLRSADKLEGQLVELTALVRHTDTAQVFTFGDKTGRQFHTIIPHPATGAATVGDTVAITGFVRHFNAGDFERDYPWFRKADYPAVKSGDWVIVATSVRTPEGTELVPPMTISETPGNISKTK